MVTDNLHVFSFPMCELLDQVSTSSFFTPLVASKLDLLPKILHEAFLVSTPIRDIIVAERVYRHYPINVFDRVIYSDIIELTILDFDIILGMY